MLLELFKRNALRLRLLVIGIVTTGALSVYKIALGGYLMGHNLEVSRAYQSTSMVSFLFFSLLGLALFYFSCASIQTFYNLSRSGKPVPEKTLERASRISRTVIIVAFIVNLTFYSVSAILMYFLNYSGRVEFWTGVRYGLFNLVTNFSTAFVATLLQSTFMDFALLKAKKLLNIHYLKGQRDMDIRTRLLLFTAATIFYMISFIALPAYNKLDHERSVRDELRRGLYAGAPREEILRRMDAEFKGDTLGEYALYTTLITLGLFVIIMGSGFLIFQEFNKRLKDVQDGLTELTKGEGDLTRRLPITKYDEIGRLIHHFNRLLQFFSDLVLSVRRTVVDVKRVSDELTGSLTTATAEIEGMIGETRAVHATLEGQAETSGRMTGSLDRAYRSIESLRARVGDQASVIEQNSAAVTEITENIREVHENTERAMQLTGELETSSTRGGEAVGDTIEAIADIAAFSKEVKEAGEIISAIAGQTNILAMNASIEAAHAGSFGKGFAVVADEVRKLAELASQSAGEILAVIRSMEEKIRRTVELAGFSGDSLDKIFDGVKRSAGLVTEIAHAMAEQTTGANEIRSSFMHLLNATEELKSFIEIQTEVSTAVKREMENYGVQSQTVTRSLQALIASDEDVKKVVGKVIELAAETNTRVGELFDRIMRFRLEGDSPATRA